MNGSGIADDAEIPAYRAFISRELFCHLRPLLSPVVGVPDLRQLGDTGGLENRASLQFLFDLYGVVKDELRAVLEQRVADRQFIDERTWACFELNAGLQIGFRDVNYRTVIGQEDADGRIVIGPRSEKYCRMGGGNAIAPLPDFLKGSHVTLFGPPDDAKLSINAMNALHRALDGEPAIVAELVKDFHGSVKWGADDEDSKTPRRDALIMSGENLTGCLDRTISHVDARTGKAYRLAADHLSVPIKRFPGLALPCAFLFNGSDPIPLHLYDFALHLFANWSNPEALVFYVPKLENEEEARYIHTMIKHAERMISSIHPQYRLGTVRVMIVLENPRAMFRLNEMMDALHPYFAGASLGWHDFLASTARLMKNDANYRIPVKADPNIVINHIKASHDLLAEVVGSRGGIKVGGMYGVLPSDADMHGASFQLAIKGFIKDVAAQMKRNLDGFWVAHPDFVRLGVALVEAWKRSRSGEPAMFDRLVCALLLPEHHGEVLDFIHGSDVRGLDREDFLYPRAMLVADGRESGSVANNSADEIRYNIFQSLQYLTDWLCGNGCVALPAQIDGVAIRVMDDLATAERSRWEVWHELHHGRFPAADFVRIAHEEVHFIRKDLSDARKIVQVKWNERTRKWYPVAMNLMMQLMASETPVEFATELLLPFTLDTIRDHEDPWAAVCAIEPAKYAIPKRVERLNRYFGICGSGRFAIEMAGNPVFDARAAERIVRTFTLDEINEAAHFHGDIGESSTSLDAVAGAEQAGVLAEGQQISTELRALGAKYRAKFGFKFLIAAQGRFGSELLEALRPRLNGSLEAEIANAREALWQITKNRVQSQSIDHVESEIAAAMAKHGVSGASVCVMDEGCSIQQLDFGTQGGRDLVTPVIPPSRFEIASLSKCVGTCFAMEFFRRAGISLSTAVNALLAKTSSIYRVRSLDGDHPEWADEVSIEHLLSHQAMNAHYVNGIPTTESMPTLRELLDGNTRLGYDTIGAINKPGTKFQYSGGGFMVLQHLIESIGSAPIDQLMRELLHDLGMVDCTFAATTGHKRYPALAAGAVATAADVGRFLVALADAHRDLRGWGPISHETAVRMLSGSDKGAVEFMGCKMGLGIFVAEGGPNRLAIHQGANEGFRSLFVHCHAGPDTGKGFVILSTGDHAGMLFVAEVAQILLRHLAIGGVDQTRWPTIGSESCEDIPQEKRVNTGYRDLIFAVFEPDLPEAIVEHGPLDPLAQFNLAIGARIEGVSNQRFARAENLISPHLPTFDPTLFGKQGKIMDSWESVRHNEAGFDWLILGLAVAATIDCVSISTQFHLGNHAEEFELEGWDEQRRAWQTIVPRMKLQGHSMHGAVSVSGESRFRRVRVRIYPDGGLTRLGLYGKGLPADERARLLSTPCRSFPAFDAQTRKPITPKFMTTPAEIEAILARHCHGEVDLASAAFGGRIVSASNEHYSPATNVISPYPPLNMMDGLESARSRTAGHSENVVIALGRVAKIARIELDFSHFVNNNPREVSIDGSTQGGWTPLVARTNVKAFGGNSIAFAIKDNGRLDQVRVTIFPDGGVNRVRVWCYDQNNA